MTVVSFYKELELENYPQHILFYEKYWEPGFKQHLWRYGYIDKDIRFAVVIKSHLLSRPNLKRLFH